jgi:23S rRNA pseudouridine2605 synthase
MKRLREEVCSTMPISQPEAVEVVAEGRISAVTVVAKTDQEKRTKKPPKLGQMLVSRKVGSSRQVRQLLKKQRVCVDGQAVSSFSFRVRPCMAVTVDSVLVSEHGITEGGAKDDGEYVPQVVVYHKPEGVVTTMSDELGRPDLSGVLPPCYAHMHPVGRLDLDTRGLLLFCSNGSLTKRLTSTKMSVEREYEALVDGEVSATCMCISAAV